MTNHRTNLHIPKKRDFTDKNGIIPKLHGLQRKPGFLAYKPSNTNRLPGTFGGAGNDNAEKKDAFTIVSDAINPSGTPNRSSQPSGFASG